MCLNVLNFLYTNDKSLLGCLKCKKQAILSIFSKNQIISGFLLFFHSKSGKYEENWEHLNVSLQSFLV